MSTHLANRKRVVSRKPGRRTFLPAGPARLFAILAAAGVCFLSLPAGADFTFERRIAGIPVTDGSPIPEPFTGGLNSPKPNLADLDADGDLDLLIVQPDGGLTYYRNQGSPSAFLFRFAGDQFQNIDANTWGTLADIDADGDLDLFTDGNGSVVYYRNVGSASVPNWQLVTTNFQGITNSGFGNTPSFVDIDGDVDLDYLEMEQNIGTARYYRNDGTAQSPSFVFVTNTFGCIDTFQGLAPAPSPSPAAETAGRATGSERHGISVISVANIDADSDKDIFIGDLTNTNLWFFRNDPVGSCSPSCSPATVCYHQATRDYLPFATLGINQARFGDLNADGDLDLLVGVTNQSAVIDNLIYFRNDGTAQNASFNLVDLNLIKAIDIGRSSQPATGDLDGDGDKDLFIGSDDGTIASFWNIGTATSPSFQRGAPLADGLGTIDVGFGAAPVWADWEGDGDLDLFVGLGSPGRIRFYSNDGTRQSMSLTLVNSQFANVQADFNATPTLGDLDGDADLDLLVGEFGVNSNPRIFYVRNDGTPQNPVWVTVCDNRPATCVFAQPVFLGDTAPELYDLDHDGDLDLLVGERQGNINFYRNDTSQHVYGASVLSRVLPFSFVLVDTAFGNVQVGLESAPEVVDIDGDGHEDLLVGEQNGGIDYYHRVPPIGISETEAPAAPPRVEMAPHPISSGSGATVTIEVGPAPSQARIALYTADGRLVRILHEGRLGAGRQSLRWDGRDGKGAPLSPGIYFLSVDLGGRVVSTKLAVTR